MAHEEDSAQHGGPIPGADHGQQAAEGPHPSWWFPEWSIIMARPAPISHPSASPGRTLCPWWLERVTTSPCCTFLSCPWRDQQSQSPCQGQSHLFLCRKFAKNKCHTRCSPGPVLGWGVQPSRCPSTSPADLFPASALFHTGDVCVWL